VQLQGVKMEILDVVDSNDQVIGHASKADVHARKLTHRISHVLIFNKEGKIALQKRDKNLAFAPSHWCTSAAGHVRSNETYEQAAHRECMEEIGIDGALKLVWKEQFDSNGTRLFLGVFRFQHDGPFTLNPEEVERIDFFSLAEIRQMLENGEKFHPELLFILEREFGIRKSIEK